MKVCPQCQRDYPNEQRFCLQDGASLVLKDPYGLVGRVLAEKYRIDALVGMGGMGAVYSAHHLRIDRKVAFKMLLPNLALSNAQVVLLFEREARMAGQLQHENIATVYDAGRTPDDIAYLIMEWLEGTTLADALARHGKLSLEHAAGVLHQIAAALDAAHAKRIIHRDLKPANVMLVKGPNGQPQVKVLDFGLAKVVSETTDAPVSALMGTPHYASPEQFRLGARIDGRTDIYSLGVMLYEMLAGTLPFNAPTIHELMRFQQAATPPPLRQVRPDVPMTIEQLVSRMLAKDPQQRPARAGEVARLFESALRSPAAAQAEAGKLAVSSAPTVIDEQEARATLLRPAATKSSVSEPTLIQKSEEKTAERNPTIFPVPKKMTRRKKWMIAGLTVLTMIGTSAAYLAYQYLQVRRNNTPPAQLVLSQLTFDPGLQGEPTWSPDGRFIAYSSNRSGNFDIWLQQVGGGNPVQVTKDPAHDWQPEFSPDGSRIAFRSERGEGGLYVIPALGGNELKISTCNTVNRNQAAKAP
ncbi:MAG: protein kinase [Acidobacteria bacterium]|nr:protein kinase [Acidobacteriota bacterium]MBI3423855.1 protein kinase [Acidobacteriota bacterium]